MGSYYGDLMQAQLELYKRMVRHENGRRELEKMFGKKFVDSLLQAVEPSVYPQSSQKPINSQ